MDYSDPSDDDNAPRDSQTTSRKRSSRGPLYRIKHNITLVPNFACLCSQPVINVGPSYKRGPPKGYIHAIESRWHQVESLLGAILQCPDARVQSILRTDELAREILGRVDAGPYGPSGRLEQPGGATKEDFFASILRSSGSTQNNDSSRSRRQSRVSREKVSSIQGQFNVLSTAYRGLSVVPTREWQDSLSNRLASSSASGSRSPSVDFTGVPLTQRRRLNGSASNLPAQPDWKDMYTLDSDNDETSQREAVEGMGALSLDEHQEVRFHGQISGLYLLAQSDRTDARKEGGLWKLPMARVWPPIKDPTELILEEDITIELPPAHVQEHLLQLYFTYVHPVFPAIHKTRFLTEYNTRLCKMWEAGATYFNSATNLLLAKVLHRSRPSTCQALLLLGFREFGIGSMEQGWIYIGMAIRMAIDLGLNCNLGDWKSGDGEQRLLFGPEETQTRRQIWWACCLADRYGSIYMGRPVAIRDEDFDTPLPDLQHLTGTPAMILGAVITKIYPVRPTSVASRQAALAKLEGLRYDTGVRRAAPPPPVLLLHIRYWGTVLLLHRALSYSIDPTPKNSPLELKAFDLAQGAASHISAIVSAYRESFSLKRCSPFLTSYLLNSGYVYARSGFFTYFLIVTLRPSNPQASLGFQQTLTALKEMEIIWPSAGRAWELLTGVKLGALNAVVLPPQSHDRHKRHAEDAFGHGPPDYPLRDEQQTGQNVDGVQDIGNKLMAHMLGLDIPGVEPSTSFYTGCDWWARPNQDSNQAMGQSWPQGSWQPGPRDVQYNNDGSIYQFDHFGV
ncbi:fungal-specific transcription factor domain-containing protein [Mycena filopes]|nr:fungal-specific transcription factor domain-containing protein [Mycena filopes]